MKIEKIILRNLTTIQGTQTIDFTAEPLSSAGLLAITGEKGSGKSTILDAICLALYNRAPRLDTVNNGTMRVTERVPKQIALQPADYASTLLRHGQKQGGIRLIFCTTDNERYETEWTIKKKRSGQYEQPERALKRLSPKKETVPDKDLQLRLEQAVGLTYDQFIHTVILSQNSFAHFLKAKTADKAILLEELTGTELYGTISKQIFQMNVEAGNQVRALEYQMKGMLHDQLVPDALAEEQERLKLLTSQKNQLEEHIAQLTRQTEWLKRFEQTSAEIKQCEEAFAASNKLCTQMRAEEMQLERYDSLLSMQPLYQEITMRRADIDQQKNDEADLFNQLNEAEKQLADKADKLTVARQRTEEAEKHFEARAEAIDRGHALTGEINVATEQQKLNEAQMKEAEFALENRQNLLKIKQEDLQKIEQDINDKQLHKQTLSAHRYMFEKFDLIKDKLVALTAETQRKEETEKKLDILQKRQLELRVQSEKALQQQHNLEARINTLKAELLIHRTTIQGLDSAKLQKAAAENRNRLAALQHALTLWRHISEGYVGISEKIAAEKREETTLAQKTDTAKKMEIILKGVSETYERISTTYTLSQSQNITRLRKQLKEGTACPVCGATHHPYHTETERELGELLTNLNKEFLDIQEDLEQKRRDLALVREEIAGLTARIETMKRARQERAERQAADLEEWKTCAYLDHSFKDCSATVNREARRTMIQVLIDNTTRAADEADKELETYNYHQQYINNLNEELEKVNSEMENNKTYLDKTTTEIHIAKATITDLQQVLYVNDRSCTELYNDLDELITLNNWFDELRTNADDLRMRLSNMHRDWNTTCTTLEETQRAADLLREEIKGAETNVEEARHAVESCRFNYDKTLESLQNKNEEMRHMFGNSTPKREAELLLQAIHQARLNENEIQSDLENMQTTLHTLKGKRDNLVQTRLNNQLLLQSSTEQLDLLILRYNGTHSPVQFGELKTLFMDSRDWKALRRKVAESKEQHMLAENRLNQARQSLLKLQAEPDRPKDESRNGELSPLVMLNQEETALNETLHSLSLCQARLLSHEHCVRRAGKLTEELEAARNNAAEWNRLNHLFGAQDGTKFRKLAQQYTFSTLVDLAGQHMQTLLPRYELHHVPGTLNIEITDHDLFDQKRSVSSLSSAETFMVCLALAMGLCSLTGYDLDTEAFFIADDFGYLDPQSLNEVLMALTRLENRQNSQMILMTSTDQVRFRLSPQIVLKKDAAHGFTAIEIR